MSAWSQATLLDWINNHGGYWFHYQFTRVFCEVNFLCYNGRPNWLGWLVMIAVAWTLLKKIRGR